MKDIMRHAFGAESLRWLADVFWDVPTSDLLQRGEAIAWPNAVKREADDLLQALEACGATGVRDVAVAYTSLFCGTRGNEPFPYESVYADDDRLLMRPVRDRVVSSYREGGFDPDKVPSNEPEDHLSTELRFCAYLIEQGGEEDVALLDRFADDHLASWVPGFAELVERMDETELYAAAARLVERFATGSL